MLRKCQATGTFFTRSYQNIPNKQDLIANLVPHALKNSISCLLFYAVMMAIFFIVSLHLLQKLPHVFILELRARKYFFFHKDLLFFVLSINYNSNWS